MAQNNNENLAEESRSSKDTEASQREILRRFELLFLQEKFIYYEFYKEAFENLPQETHDKKTGVNTSLEEEAILILAQNAELRRKFIEDLKEKIKKIRKKGLADMLYKTYTTKPEDMLMMSVEKKIAEQLKNELIIELEEATSSRYDDLLEKSATLLKNPSLTLEERIDVLKKIETPKGEMTVTTQNNKEVKKAVNDVIMTKLRQKQYHYEHLTSGAGRKHPYELKSKLFQGSGDKIKSQILLDFKAKLDACDSETKIDEFVAEFKEGMDYKDHIQHGQGWFTATFGTKKLGEKWGIKTSSEQAIEDMILEAKQKFSSKNSL